MHYSVIREFYHNGNHCGYIQVYPHDAKHLYFVILDMHTMHKQVYMSVEHRNEYAYDVILCVLNTLTSHLAHDDHGRMYMFEEYVLSSSGHTSQLSSETARQVMETLDPELLLDGNAVTTFGRIVCEEMGTLRMMYDGEPWTPGCGDNDVLAMT